MQTTKRLLNTRAGHLLLNPPQIKPSVVGGLFLFLLSFVVLQFSSSTYLAVGTISNNLTFPSVNTTKSSFIEKILTEEKGILFTTQFIEDPTLEIGKTKILQEGREGKEIITFKLSFHKEILYSKELINSKISEPTMRRVAKGTKIIWRTINTPTGELKYWRNLNVYATSYDPNCTGCSNTTATGMRAGYGVIAVDPNIIPLGTQVYIPGYGTAIAGDTGGSIQGNVIDLGFNDLSEGWWSSKYTNIYLLSR